MAYILVVDDDDAFRALMRAFLMRDGHEVVEAANGRECEEAVGKRLPDLVVMDLVMPERDGMQTIPSLRRQYPDLKIIAVSGGSRTGRFDYLDFATKLGAHAVLAKPFTRDEFLAVVKPLLA